MYQIVLVTHLIGTFILFFLICQTILAFKKDNVNIYINLAVRIAIITGLQLLTGAILTIISLSEANLTMYCSKIGLYIGVILTTEYILYKKARKKNILFPIKTVAIPIAIGLASNIAFIVII